MKQVAGPLYYFLSLAVLTFLTHLAHLAHPAHPAHLTHPWASTIAIQRVMKNGPTFGWSRWSRWSRSQNKGKGGKAHPLGQMAPI
jgi:hypothetical protein